jgi:hypothetical protein
MEQGLYIKLYVKVRTEKEMSTEELIDAFEQNCDYNIIGTDDIVVTATEYLETTL